ncbi:MFS transporter [Kushneria aurantia]|uniref:MFS transporter n=1 Tax=Kushneria aurantia TaxID=504092 RepID=A0ABV6G1M2_9GAMM|nr:MFS transporter [Kushneria aurantia]
MTDFHGVRRPLSVRRHILLVLLPFTFAYLISELVRNVNGVLAPALRQNFALTAFDLGLLTAAFLVALAGSQLVVGVLLDRYGPKRMVVATIGIAALACIGFALAEGLLQLMLARFLMGLGLCACWTGAYKANALWWPSERLPLVNAVTISFASLGSLLATWPTEVALAIFSWRWLFALLAGVIAALALFMLLAVPRHPQESRGSVSHWREQIDGMLGVARGRVFLVVAPLSFVTQGVWIAYQGLWAGEWLRESAGWSKSGAAMVLTALALSLVVGQMGFGVIADRLARSSRGLFRMTALLCATFIAVQVFLVIHPQGFHGVVWAAWGALTAGPILGYALLTRLVPPTVSGSAIALLNFCAVLSGALFQGGIGLVVDLMSEASTVAAQRLALCCLVALQLAALAWMWWGKRGLALNSAPSETAAMGSVSRETSVGDEAPPHY